jgi:hypothetical protein
MTGKRLLAATTQNAKTQGRGRFYSVDSPQMNTMARGLTGAAVGGAVGYFTFFWIAHQGFYALVLPAALVGSGGGLCAGGRSKPLAIVCGVAGLVLGLFTEWRFAPFVADSSLVYFMTHIHALKPITLIMVLVGAALSYWLALGGIRTATTA